MLRLDKSALTGFSIISTFDFIGGFVCVRMYGLHGWGSTNYAPCILSEVPWMMDSLQAILIGLIAYLVVYEANKVEKAKGKKVPSIPRVRFRNFYTAILFFAALFFCFIFIFVIREYNEYSSEITYMLRETFWQYCATNIPWLEILATSLIFGIILAVGFSTTAENKSQEDKK